MFQTLHPNNCPNLHTERKKKEWNKKSVSISLCIYLRTFVCVNVRVYVCMHICMYVRMRVCTYVCMCVFMYVRMYVRMCVCTYVSLIYLLISVFISLTHLLTDTIFCTHPLSLSLSLSFCMCLPLYLTWTFRGTHEWPVSVLLNSLHEQVGDP